MADEYATTDLGQAAFLVVLGYALLAVGGEPGARRTFRFMADAAQDAPRFFQRATVEARAYATALRDLKALVLAR